MSVQLCPTTIKKANDFVEKWHRHSGRTAIDGGKWSVGCYSGGVIVGVAIVGNPVSRHLMDGWTAEVLRVCVLPDAPKNSCSLLYGACWRAWRAMGGARMVTYTLQKENGASLRAVGWTPHVANNGPWDHGKRARRHQDIYLEEKFRWEIGEKRTDAPPIVPEKLVQDDLFGDTESEASK
jgi:hypothetical protein